MKPRYHDQIGELARLQNWTDIMSSLHPFHDEIAKGLRELYSESIPEAGIVVERLASGLLRYSRANPTSCDIYLHDIQPAQVPELLERISTDFADRSLNIYVDDRARDARLGPRLVTGGIERHNATTILAYCGGAPQGVERDDVTIETVSDDFALYEAVRTKLMAFANSEEEPQANAIEEEFAIRKSEMPVGARCVLARAEGEGAAMVSYYEMPDSLIFQLATRLPFRGRGIARHLMELTIRGRLGEGGRSVLVNCDEEGTPAKFYRRLGFVDEVYWRQRYSLPHASG